MAPQISIPVAANVLGTIGTVLWCVQLTPQIWHNWKKKKTDGLPGLMMFLFAALAQNTFDVLGAVLYIICVLLELGIFISQGIWLVRTRKLRKQAKLEGKDFDDLPEAWRYQDTRSENPDSRRPSTKDGAIPDEKQPTMTSGQDLDSKVAVSTGVPASLQQDGRATPNGRIELDHSANFTVDLERGGGA
ncbi:hypothetical protein MMC06_002168 [Schaereria dolodes]|nr:hypothetical protein [Schaereria dolodes]